MELSRSSVIIGVETMGYNMDKFCPNCGLEYRRWAINLEEFVCEECNWHEWNTLVSKNITLMKRRKVGQEHITEHSWFPKKPEGKHMVQYWKKRRTQK